MRKIIAIALVVIMASFAQAADPTLVANDGVDVGGGLTGYTISGVADTDSFFVLTDVVFTADPGTTFELHFGGAIQDEATVLGTGGDLSLVSYYFDEFSEVAPGNTAFAATSLTLNSVSMIGGNPLSSNISALYIVADGNFSWAGDISVAPEGGQGSTYQVAGEVPEPATLTLLGLGAVALIRRKRK